jgi:hypothetical protein
LGWAKLPVWYDARENAKVERIAWFAEQLSIQNIELVGVLDQPPEELRQVFREPGRLPVASVFIEPELWQPVVNPVMTRLSLKVRWWQLGDDLDASFVGFAGVESKVAEIKRHLEQYGQEVRLGIGWRWLHEAPALSANQNAPWAYLSYHAEPELTAEELASYLQMPTPAADAKADVAEQKGGIGALNTALRTRAERRADQPASGPAAQRWVVLAPVAEGEYSPETRTRDLVLRMLSARIHGAGTVFVPNPFHDRQGLLYADGSPGELFVPWRTTAHMIGGREYIGRIQLPGGSTSHVFARDGQAVMAVWSDAPTTECLYLGEQIEQIDVWGRSQTPKVIDEAGRPQHEVVVGPMPTFVTGLSESVARWQAALAFENPRLASIFGREQSIVLQLKNTFGQGVGGELTLHGPKSWSNDTRPMRFKLAHGDNLRLPLPVTLQPDANSGPQPVRLDFEITAERTYRFSVYRTLQLGLEDVQIELTTRMRSDGALIVEQQLTNLSNTPVSFQCLLFPQGRRREMRQVIGQEQGSNKVTFVLPNGEELLGQKLWLRAEEIGGQRVLNCTVTAER